MAVDIHSSDQRQDMPGTGPGQPVQGLQGLLGQDSQEHCIRRTLKCGIILAPLKDSLCNSSVLGDENKYSAINSHWVMSELDRNIVGSTLLQDLCEHERCVMREPKQVRYLLV